MAVDTSKNDEAPGFIKNSMKTPLVCQEETVEVMHGGESDAVEPDPKDSMASPHVIVGADITALRIQADTELIEQHDQLSAKVEDDPDGSLTPMAPARAALVEHDKDGIEFEPTQTVADRNDHHLPSILNSQSASPDEQAPVYKVKHNGSSRGISDVGETQDKTSTGRSTSSDTDRGPVTLRQNMVSTGISLHELVNDDVTESSEIRAICSKIKRVLDLRHSFMMVSHQLPGANPEYPKHTPISSMKAPSANTSGISNRSEIHVTTEEECKDSGANIAQDLGTIDREVPTKADLPYKFVLDSNGVYQVHTEDDALLTNVPTLQQYYEALDGVLEISSDGPTKSFAYRRLQFLEGRFGLYTLVNQYKEVSEIKRVPHRDFYNVRKVDTHVHHSACINQKHLLRFIKSKVKHYPEDVVLEQGEEGRLLTLAQVFDSIQMTAHDLSIDALDMHAHTDSFHRFDKFNSKYNPIGHSQLRDIFLKTDNYIKGRYLAEITKEAITDLEDSKYQMVEWRISIYGRSLDEWDKLAAWVVDNDLFSSNVRWLIQIPRLFSVYKSLGSMNSFEELLQNLFRPLFEVTQDPSSHPKLHIFLERVIGFDSVDDESKVERSQHSTPAPKDWVMEDDPPYKYWIYFIFANMSSLNAWRRRRELNTFVFRPHCGEAGDTDHLAAAILCCHSISHGITLRKVPLIQYIFYLDQIGIAMSPLSNNALFLTYDRNPFPSYFKQGLNVSLSTDDPLQFALTREPLIEEYSIAAQIYKLSAVDRCELAKNSVHQSGFELTLKQRWLGRYCYLPGVLGNDIGRTNVPNLREGFRFETLRAELEFIARFTDEFSHLERHCPVFADSNGHLVATSEVYEMFQSPQQYYARDASSISCMPNRSTSEQNESNSWHV